MKGSMGKVIERRIFRMDLFCKVDEECNVFRYIVEIK